MKTQLFIFLLSVAVIVTYSIPSIILANSDKDYCYDQVGDGHFCFDTKENCRQEQKTDEIAESPCYNKDRN